MNISNATAAVQLTAMRKPEAAERGPDRDGDADDGARAAPAQAQAQAKPAVGTGLRIDTWA